MTKTAALATAILLLPRIASAQAEPDSVKHRNNCRLAEQVIATGHPAPHDQWALDLIGGCPEGGEALANALRLASQSTDTAYLDRLTRPTLFLRDGNIFAAALTIASERSATETARVFALRSLIYAMRPTAGIDYGVLATDQPTFCVGSASPHRSFTQGAPLPHDYAEQIHTLAWRIVRDTSESPILRHAAQCAAMATPDP